MEEDWYAYYAENPHLRLSLGGESSNHHWELEQRKSALNTTLRAIGVVVSTAEELSYYEKYQHWSIRDFDSVATLIEQYRIANLNGNVARRDGLISVIKTVINDLTALYDYAHQSLEEPILSTQDELLMRLSSINIFLTEQKKKTLDWFTNQEITELIDRIDNLDSIPISQTTIIDKELDSIRDIINALTVKYEQTIKEPVPFTKKPSIAVEATNAAYRVAAKQVIKATSQMVAGILPAGKGKDFVSSELGQSFLSMLSGLALTQVAKDGTKTEKLARELRISGMTGAGNFVIEELLDMVSGVVEETLADTAEEVPVTVEEYEYAADAKEGKQI